MEQKEKFFKCPYCFERISVLIDLTEEGQQHYTEDCEVCCHPIDISFVIEDGKLRQFTHNKSGGF